MLHFLHGLKLLPSKKKNTFLCRCYCTHYIAYVSKYQLSTGPMYVQYKWTPDCIYTICVTVSFSSWLQVCCPVRRQMFRGEEFTANDSSPFLTTGVVLHPEEHTANTGQKSRVTQLGDGGTRTQRSHRDDSPLLASFPEFTTTFPL